MHLGQDGSIVAAREAIVGGDRVHRTTSRDGTEIGGWVVGSGPPLVLVHGGLGDGNPAMDVMVPFLSQHFTCYCMSTRGRGMSGDHPDHSRERMYEDVAAFVSGVVLGCGGARPGVFVVVAGLMRAGVGVWCVAGVRDVGVAR